MTDIVERLRDLAALQSLGCRDDCADAADEIERLQAKVNELDGMWRSADKGGQAEIERLREALRDLISADDAMLAFLLAVTSQELGEPEWDRQHKERSQQKRSATLAALALIEGGK